MGYNIGEGNVNPLQCSCLENPRDGGAWWAAVSGVTQSQTQLKRLSSSSSSRMEVALTSEVSLKQGPGATPYGVWQTLQAGHGGTLCSKSDTF